MAAIQSKDGVSFKDAMEYLAKQRILPSGKVYPVYKARSAMATENYWIIKISVKSFAYLTQDNKIGNRVVWEANDFCANDWEIETMPPHREEQY